MQKVNKTKNNTVFQIYKSSKQWGIFPVRKNQGIPHFTLPIGKNVKIFPVREIKWSFVYTSVFFPADKYVLTDS